MTHPCRSLRGAQFKVQIRKQKTTALNRRHTQMKHHLMLILRLTRTTGTTTTPPFEKHCKHALNVRDRRQVGRTQTLPKHRTSRAHLFRGKSDEDLLEEQSGIAQARATETIPNQTSSDSEIRLRASTKLSTSPPQRANQALASVVAHTLVVLQPHSHNRNAQQHMRDNIHIALTTIIN
jgi:hypothetical protein